MSPRHWVQDAEEERAIKLVRKANVENLNRSPRGSKYVIGEAKSRQPGKKGIYFEDPTE